MDQFEFDSLCHAQENSNCPATESAFLWCVAAGFSKLSDSRAKNAMMRRLLCCVLLASGAWAMSVPDAGTQFAQLVKQAKDARQKKDYSALVTASLRLARLLNDSGPATEQVAMAYAEAGRQKEALQALGEFVAMGQSDDQLASRVQFASMKSSPEFQKLLAQMRANELPIERAVVVTRFPDAGLLPEDIDYDEQTRSFLVTSVLEKKIVRINMNGSQKDFARAPDGWPMLALKIDARRGVAWATEVALNGFAAAPAKDWGRSAVVCFRLADGRLMRRIEGPPHSALGDMALAPDGDAIVSDNDGGGVYRIRADAKDAKMERVDAGQFISPQTATAEEDGRHVFVPDYVRGVGALDMETEEVRWIEADGRHAMQGIDGLYFTDGVLIATQNGSSPERVVRFALDAGLGEVTGESVIERSTPTGGDPTHGVVVGRDFYYIANSGWNSLDDSGKVKAGAKMTPAILMKSAVK
jgi:hypothetical protein